MKFSAARRNIFESLKCILHNKKKVIQMLSCLVPRFGQEDMPSSTKFDLKCKVSLSVHYFMFGVFIISQFFVVSSSSSSNQRVEHFETFFLFMESLTRRRHITTYERRASKIFSER